MTINILFVTIFCLACFSAIAATVARHRSSERTERRVDEFCGPIEIPLRDEKFSSKRRSSSLFHFVNEFSVRLGIGNYAYANKIFLALLGTFAVPAWYFFGWVVAALLVGASLTTYGVALRWLQRRRARAFVEQLPVFLERVRQLILVGNTFQQAFAKAAASAGQIIRENIDFVVRRVQHGASLADSIDVLARQLDIVEVHMLSAYVRANTKFGGKLSQSLVLLIEQMSNKTRLEREIKAATAETRASAMALCLLTVGVIGLVSILNKNYVAFFLDSQLGHMILAGIVTWPLVGLFVMKRILSIDY